jgi:hypothetical protein
VKISRYLEASEFLREIRNLRLSHDYPSDATLERLERQRILIPRLRLRYPDPIERRWFAMEDERYHPSGRLERDGKRWDHANDLERARQHHRNFPLRESDDPLVQGHRLDSPRPEWAKFIQHPSRRRFVPWQDFRVNVAGENCPTWKSQTVVTYYSSWQFLLYLECARMGVNYLGNTEGWDWVSGDVPDTFELSISFEPIRSLRAFRDFSRMLDAVVWFSEEDRLNDSYVLRHSSGRRMLEDYEVTEMERRAEILSQRCKVRFRVTYPQLIKLSKFLAGRWGHWNQVGYTHHAKTYRIFLARTLELARYLRNVPVDTLINDVGRVTGHFKATLKVIFSDWVAEWREDAERLLLSFARPGALLALPITPAQVDDFLGFIEARGHYEFYWRWRSINERAFADDSNRLAGLRSDLQSMALTVEHIVDDLIAENVPHPKQALFEKFKQIWPATTAVGRLLLRDAEFRTKAYSKAGPDLSWFDSKQKTDESVEIATDLAVCHAIRGSAHHRIVETDQLRLERLSLILLRGVLRAFLEARNRWPLPSPGTPA